MNKQKFPSTELLILAVGELIVALLVIVGYLVADTVIEGEQFTYRVFTGLLLGSVVTIANYLFMILSVNKQINRFVELRGSAEMDDEAAAKFAKENSAPIQTAITLSFIIRTASMVVTLVIALLLNCFAPIATVIPLLAFRPIITVGELVRAKLAKKDNALQSEILTETTTKESDK